MDRGLTEIQSLSAIEHLLEHHPKRVRQISFLTQPSSPRQSRILELAKAHKIPHQIDPRKKHEPEPIRATIQPFEYCDLKELLKSQETEKRGCIVLLDHIQDPQNFGAICRTAEGLGVTALVLPKDRSVAVTAGVYHASAGAVQSIPICRVSNLGDAVLKLKDAGYWVVGTSLGESTVPLAGVPELDKIALILGSEGDGMKHSLTKNCDYLVEIPLAGKVQSLNVSVAAAILIYHFCRP